jgi:hypothetical protein
MRTKTDTELRDCVYLSTEQKTHVARLNPLSHRALLLTKENAVTAFLRMLLRKKYFPCGADVINPLHSIPSILSICTSITSSKVQ